MLYSTFKIILQYNLREDFLINIAQFDECGLK